jgi:hypothetical protein
MNERKMVEVVDLPGFRRRATIRQGGSATLSLCTDILSASGLEGVRDLRIIPLARIPGLVVSTLSPLEMPLETEPNGAPAIPPKPLARGVMSWHRKMSKNGEGRNIGLGSEMLKAAGMSGLYDCDIVLCPDGLLIRRHIEESPPIARVVSSGIGEEELF